MNWKRAFISLLFIMPLVALLAFGMTRDPNAIPSPLPGRAAPSFELAVLDDPVGALTAVTLKFRPDPEEVTPGRRVNLAEHHGEVVVLNFWASWCLGCRDEHVPLSRVAEMYRGRGVHFYGVLYNDSPENARRWIRQMGGQSYGTLLDPGSSTAINYGLYGVPETFFIGRDGRVAYKHIGPIHDRILIEWIERLLDDQAEETT